MSYVVPSSSADRSTIGAHSVPLICRPLRWALSRGIDGVRLYLASVDLGACPACRSPRSAGLRHTASCRIVDSLVWAVSRTPRHWFDHNDGLPDPRFVPIAVMVNLGRIN